MSLSIAACIVPPSVQEAPSLPNQPPIILRDEVEPSLDDHVSLCPGERQSFRIPVRDENVSDHLELRLFVQDAELDDPVLLGTFPQPSLMRAEPVRILLAEISDPCAGLTPPGILEAVVSDRGFTGAGGRETPQDAGLTTTAAWLLECPTAEVCLPPPEPPPDGDA